MRSPDCRRLRPPLPWRQCWFQVPRAELATGCRKIATPFQQKTKQKHILLRAIPTILLCCGFCCAVLSMCCSVMLCHALFCPVMFCSVMLCSVVFVMFCGFVVLSCQCAVLSCYVMLCSVLSCCVLSCSSCSVLSCHVLSCSSRARGGMRRDSQGLGDTRDNLGSGGRGMQGGVGRGVCS